MSDTTIHIDAPAGYRWSEMADVCVVRQSLFRIGTVL